MTVIANFTADPLPWKHVGHSGVLKPNDIVEFETGRANHILNKMGARGLVVMKYGEKEEDKRAEAKQKYLDFWEHQITVFNQQNEIRKNEHRAYVFPSKQIKEKAKEFGVKLIGPWELDRPVDDKKMVMLERENLEQREVITSQQKQLTDLSEKIDLLMEMVTSSTDSKKNKKG